MTLLFVLALWAAARLESAETTRDYLLVGFLVGLAAALKYQGALVAVAVPVVHLASRRPLVDARIVVAAAGAIIGFLLTTPGVLMDAGAFGSGFTELWDHVSPGEVAETPGWWRHLSLSLWTAYGPAGLALCLAGLGLVLQRRRPAELGLAAAFLLYFALIGSAKLTFVRYALPLAPLAAVLITIAIGRCGRWAPVALVAVLAPSLYGSARIADLRLSPDTRVEAATWLDEHVAAGTVICNFGGWAGDPAARTFEDVWWKISQLVRSADAPTLAETLAVLDQSKPPVPFVSYAVQTGNQDLAVGSRPTVEALDCDCVATHNHALSFSTVTSYLTRELGGVATVRASFDPGPAAASARYDELDALYLPLAGFGDLRVACPAIDLWQRRSAQDPRNWRGRDVIARALMCGVRSLVDEGQDEAGLHLVQQALSSVPDSQDSRLFRGATDVFRQLGLPGPARASEERAAALDR